MRPARIAVCAVIATAVVAAAGCGGSGTKSSSSPPALASPSSSVGSPPPPAAPPPPGAAPLQAEAAGTAAGDIPDNQVFLVFRNGVAGYSIKYPEGWAQSGSGRSVTFRDKNNIVRIVVTRRPRPSTTSVASSLRSLRGARIQQRPTAMTVGGAASVKVVYTTESAANPVTGKRVTLTVDRYYLGHAGKEAIVDLGTPVGVDNVDAYRLMIESLRWR